jgi:glycosyltransferase involved in cell wall biosynthesis
MRIGIDGRELLNKRTGVGRYLASLCSQWIKKPPSSEIEFVLYTPTDAVKPFRLDLQFNSTLSKQFRHCQVAGRSNTWWEQIKLPMAANKENLDVFFSPAYSVPLRLTAPTVVTMHDISFATHPEWFSWREGIRRRWLSQQALSRANLVITVSEFSRNEILRHFNVLPNRIRVVRSGIKKKNKDETRRTEPLILYVGSIFNRRNLPTLIRAIRKVRTCVPNATLTIVGDDRTYPKQNLARLTAQQGMQDHVNFLSYVSESELATLYKRASVFVFLSEYEGFGLTPLEALAAGIPIVVAETKIAREIYQEAATYVPIADVNVTSDAIVSLLTNSSLRSQQNHNANNVLRKFNWEHAAHDTILALKEAAR